MLKQLIEAYLFAAGKGISYPEIVDAFSELFSEGEINTAFKELIAEYSGEDGKGIIIINYNGKYQMQSNPSYGSILSEKLQLVKEKELSKILLETLAIVAYKQPVTRLEIEDMRDHRSADYAISALISLNLIEPAGRKDAPGRPWLFATTDEFLRKFGLTCLDDLPNYDDLILTIRNNYDKYNMRTNSLFRDKNLSIDDDDGDGEGVAFNPISGDLSELEAEEEIDENLENPDFLVNTDDIFSVD